jgi:hypothetical protein
MSQTERLIAMQEALNELVQYSEVLKKTNEIIHGKASSINLHSLHESLDRGQNAL